MRHEAQLDAPVSAKDPKLGTVRAHLEKLAEWGDTAAAARLAGPECPDDLEYLLAYSIELAIGRRYGAHGAEAITWVDLDAWARQTSRTVDRDEVLALMRLDRVHLYPGDITEPAS